MAREKRSNGEGCWGKKIVKGEQYYFYRDVNGKYTYARTQKEVKEKLKKKSDLTINQNTRFGRYLSDWLKLKKNTIEQTTYDDYEDLVRNMVLEYNAYNLAELRISSLTPRVFQDYLNSLATKYSKASITKVWQLIKQCLKYGEIQKELKPNLAAFVKVPLESNVATKKKKIPFLNEIELERLYNLLDNFQDKKNNYRYRYSNNAHAIILIAYTGMRVGEMTALKWRNVNIDEAYIDITEATGRIKEENGKYIYVDKTPKTKSSIRRIPLPNRAIEMLEYFSEIPHGENDLVCVTDNHTRINSRNINHTLERMCKEADLPKLSIHSLRHTYGSVLLNKGADIKTISNLLGHTNISTTYDIYIGVNEETKIRAAKLFDE